jgi:predicted MPP superfamily phosphohydrolase
MRWIFFSFPVFLFYGGICFYVGRRLLNFIHFYTNVNALLFWIVFTLVCCGLILSNFSRHNLNFIRLAVWIGVAFLMYLFIFFVIADLVKLVLFLAGKKSANINLYTAAAVVCLCVLVTIYGVFHAHSIKTVNYNITLQGTGTDIRIVLISDLHIGSTVKKSWVKRIVEKANNAQGDIVFIAGDIFDGNLDIVKDIQGVISNLKTFNAPLGVYAVLGNHDVDRQSFSGGRTERIAQIMKEADIVLLQDEMCEIREGLFLAGRKDARPIGMNAERKTALELLSGIDGTIIVLDHQPTQFPQLQDAGADLVFSGHTHNGQLFPANLLTKIIFKKAGSVSYGYWQGKTMQGVVTSGAGVWGPPLRVGTNSEITVINLKFMQ